MSLTRAVFDAMTQTYLERLFHFEPAPLVPGRCLEDDIELYLTCGARAGALPNSLSLLFMGSGAEALFLRRAATREEWQWFMGRVMQSHPVAAARQAALMVCVAAMAAGDRSGATRT